MSYFSTIQNPWVRQRVLRIVLMQMPGKFNVGAFSLQSYFLAKCCWSEMTVSSAHALRSTLGAGGHSTCSLLQSVLLQQRSRSLPPGRGRKPWVFQSSRAGQILELLVPCVSLDYVSQEAVKDGDEFYQEFRKQSKSHGIWIQLLSCFYWKKR